MRTVAAAAGCGILSATPAAAELTRTFQVDARVVPGCVVATDAGGRWGTIDLGSTPGAIATSVAATLLSTAGNGLSIECTPGVAAALSADAGDHPSAGERHLQRGGGTDLIRYRLYVDGGTSPWTGISVPLAFTGAVRIVPIRAVATLAGPTAAGRYTDTVRVTLSW